MNSRTRHASPAASSSYTRICWPSLRSLKSSVVVKRYTSSTWARDGTHTAPEEGTALVAGGAEGTALVAGGAVGTELVAGGAEGGAGDAEEDWAADRRAAMNITSFIWDRKDNSHEHRQPHLRQERQQPWASSASSETGKATAMNITSLIWDRKGNSHEHHQPYLRQERQQPWASPALSETGKATAMSITSLIWDRKGNSHEHHQPYLRQERQQPWASPALSETGKATAMNITSLIWDRKGNSHEHHQPYLRQGEGSQLPPLYCPLYSTEFQLRQRASRAFSSKRLSFVDTVLWLCLSQSMKHWNGSHRCPS